MKIELSEILTNLHDAVIDESNTGDSEVSNQRERNYRAYYMEPLESDLTSAGESADDDDTPAGGRTDFVTADVFDTVEDAKAYLSDAFAPHRNVIRFKPSSERDVDQVEVANQYVKKIFWDMNNGFQFIRDAAHDGNITKNAIAKIYWCDDAKFDTLNVDNIPPDDVATMLADERVEPADNFQRDIEVAEGVEVMVYSGDVVIETDISYQKVELIPPENFFADHNQRDANSFLVAQDRVETSIDELIEMGVTEEQAGNLNPKAKTDLRETENQARHENDSTYDFYMNHTITDNQNQVWLYNGYFMADIDGNGIHAWYIKYVGGLIIGDEDAIDDLAEMSIEKAIEGGYISKLENLPYRTWSPYPLSHRWSGMALADPVYVIQEMRTKLQRSIIDFSARTNNPRLMGDSENVRNFAEVVENPIGGFIDLEDPMSPLTPLQQPMMSPMVFQTLEMVTTERDDRVPVTRLAAGRMQEAVSEQNAENMVERMALRGEKRMSMVARNFAHFLREILLEVYRLGVEYDDRKTSIEVGGEWMEIIPSNLPKRTEMHISVALTPQEAGAEAMRLMSMHNEMKSDEQLASLYTRDKRYAMMCEVAELLDRRDFSRFLSDPNDEEFIKGEQAQQQAAAQQAQQQMQQQAEMQTAMQLQIVQMQGQFAVQMEQTKAESAQMLKRMEGMIESARLMLLERKEQREDEKADIDKKTAVADIGKTIVETEAQQLENDMIESGTMELLQNG